METNIFDIIRYITIFIAIYVMQQSEVTKNDRPNWCRSKICCLYICTHIYFSSRLHNFHSSELRNIYAWWNDPKKFFKVYHNYKIWNLQIAVFVFHFELWILFFPDEYLSLLQLWLAHSLWEKYSYVAWNEKHKMTWVFLFQ